MTEQEVLIYNIYKLTNSVDDKIYFGSTRRKLNVRMQQHRHEARSGCKKKVSKHMRKIGMGNFQIELLEKVTVPNRKEALKVEQKYIDNTDKSIILNSICAYSENYNKTRDINKKRKTRRDFYHRKILDPIWHEKEKERNRNRMRIKRLKEKQNKEKSYSETISETEREWA